MMTPRFDPADDFTRVTDGLAPVSVMRPGTTFAAPVARALCRAIRTRELQPSGGRYTAGDVVWYLPAAELPAVAAPGDVLIDEAGRRWTVLDVQQTALKSCWRCVCRDLAVVHGLDQEITLEKAEYCKSPGGAEEVVWRVERRGVRARIQPVAAQAAHEHDRQANVARSTVYCEEDIALDHSWRIRGSDGAVYRIVACRKAQRIDALMEVDVIRDTP